MDKNYDVIIFISKYYYFEERRPGVAIFADIIKIITWPIKQIFKDSRKAKRIRIMY